MKNMNSWKLVGQGKHQDQTKRLGMITNEERGIWMGEAETSNRKLGEQIEKWQWWHVLSGAKEGPWGRGTA